MYMRKMEVGIGSRVSLRTISGCSQRLGLTRDDLNLLEIGIVYYLLIGAEFRMAFNIFMNISEHSYRMDSGPSLSLLACNARCWGNYNNIHSAAGVSGQEQNNRKCWVSRNCCRKWSMPEGCSNEECVLMCGQDLFTRSRHRSPEFSICLAEYVSGNSTAASHWSLAHQCDY